MALSALESERSAAFTALAALESERSSTLLGALRQQAEQLEALQANVAALALAAWDTKRMCLQLGTIQNLRLYIQYVRRETEATRFRLCHNLTKMPAPRRHPQW